MVTVARLSEKGVVGVVVAQDVRDVSAIFPTCTNFPAFHNLAGTIFRVHKSPYWPNFKLVEHFNSAVDDLDF